MTVASTALRGHARQVQGVTDARRLNIIEQQHFRDMISASFEKAQSAWDSYRKHVAKHGVVPAMRPNRVAA